MSLKAITTLYKGYRFRSRLEARWAIFFDAASIGWEYEPEGYQLGNSKYLADFKLKTFGKHAVDLFVEIKPNKPKPEVLKACYELASTEKTDLVIICGTPDLPEFADVQEKWKLKSGHVILLIPGKYYKGDEVDGSANFDVWNQTNRLSLFHTDIDGNYLDIWPFYWLLENLNDKVYSYKIVSKVRDTAFGLHCLNNNGHFISSHYLAVSETSIGRITDHPRLMYAYQLAKSARFEHDEFNIKIIDGFYEALDKLPFSIPYSSEEDSWSLYYRLADKSFISRRSNEKLLQNNVFLVKSCPHLIIKQFVSTFKDRPSNIQFIVEAWEGFLFRYGIRLKDKLLIRTYFDK